MSFSGEYYPTDNPLVVKVWEKKLWSEFRKSDAVFNPKLGLTGKDPETSAFVHLDLLEKSIGDKVTVGWSWQTQDDAGVIGSEVLEGKEDTIETADFSMTIDLQRFGYRSRGQMNKQRVHFSILDVARANLRDKFKTRRAVSVCNHLCNNTNQTSLKYLGLNALPASIDDEHVYRVGQGLGTSNDETVNADNTAILDVDTVDEIVTICTQLTPPIAPIVIDGNPYYILLMHPDVIGDLRKSDTQWYSTMVAALQGGLRDSNPLFTRALGKWRDVLFFEETHLTHGVAAATPAANAALVNTRRSVFLGAGALALAYGRKIRGEKEAMTWYNGTWDHGDKYFGSASMVWGCKCPVFADTNGTSRRPGSMIITSYTTPRVKASPTAAAVGGNKYQTYSFTGTV